MRTIKKRPIAKPEPTMFDRTLEIAGWGVWTLVWLLTLAAYSGLPDVIPIHYNVAGRADGFGGKFNILILCLIMTVLFVGITVLNRFPHLFNGPVAGTKDNAPVQYRHATTLMRCLKLAIVVIFGLIVLKTVQYA